MEIIDEIKEWLKIRQIARDRKDFDIADRIKNLVEEIYKLKVGDTERAVCWTWNELPF